MSPSKRIKGNNGSKKMIWRQQHYESKTSGQQKHWRELFHSILLHSITIVRRKKALLLLSLWLLSWEMRKMQLSQSLCWTVPINHNKNPSELQWNIWKKLLKSALLGQQVGNDDPNLKVLFRRHLLLWPDVCHCPQKQEFCFWLSRTESVWSLFFHRQVAEFRPQRQ